MGQTMLQHNLMHQPSHGMSRRGVLQLGQLTALGVGLSQLPMSLGAVSKTATAKNCILIWLDGGPSHLETFDLKPAAPVEVRGPLNAIQTSVAGVSLSECLPGLAQRMSDIAVIRSMTSPLGEHNLGAHYLLTGYRPSPVLQYPSFHAVANQQLGNVAGALPNNIAIPEYRVGGAGFDGTGFLPSRFGAFSVGGDPAKKDYRVRDLIPPDGFTLDRIDRRRSFAKKLATLNSSATAPSQSLANAFEIVTSPAARTAFDLDDESPATRGRYGSKSVGQSCLMARRLVERGVHFVTVNQRGWDTHENLYTRLKEGYTGAKVGVGLIPSLDLAVSALIDDLKQSGLLDETLVVVMGEFGRTPKINTLGGRDHWPRVFSVALAGGGVKGGQVIGASDSVGESPADRPVTPSDLVCTIYSLLGIDPAAVLKTEDGRPVRLAADDASVVQELLS
jgi:hypothetical protein